jgi:hypothetical protein
MHKGRTDDGYICSSKHMLKEYRERPQDFTRQIVAVGLYETCRSFEITLIKAMFAQNVLCYNLNYGGVVLHTPEIKSKISATHKGKVISEEHKLAIRVWHQTKRSPTSEETKERIRQARIGVPRPPLSAKWKENISKSLTGKKRSKEFGAAITARQLGTKRSPHTDAVKEKIRRSQLGRKHTPETIEKLRAAKANVSLETKAKISAAKKAYWARKRLSENA